MDRDVKRQIKHDEFIEGTAKIFHYLEHNPKPFLYGAAGFVGLVLAGWGLSTYLGGRAQHAADEFAQGVAALHAPLVAGEAPRPKDPYRPTFASEAERAKEAAARLDEAAGTGGRAGRIAGYLRGIALVEAGDAAGAVKALEEARAGLGQDRTLGPAVRGALAGAYFAAGQFEQSAAAWRELSNEAGYPKDLALAGLAQALEGAGKHDEAKSAYQQVVSEFETSPMAGTARAAMARLGS